MKIEDYNDVLTAKDLMEILGVGLNKVYELLNTGQIRSFRVGAQRRVLKSYVYEYIDRMTANNT